MQTRDPRIVPLYITELIDLGLCHAIIDIAKCQRASILAKTSPPLNWASEMAMMQMMPSL